MCVSLAACASLTTPKYAVHPGAGGAPPPPVTGSTAHGTNAPYQVGGIWYVPHEQPGYDMTGIASWSGSAFNMKATANGELFDMSRFSAAHTTLPLPSMVEVTNLDNGRKLIVRVNDRGPFVGGRLIDLSQAAAAELGYERAGTAHVRVRYVGPAPLAGPEAGVRMASNAPFTPRYPASASPGSKIDPPQAGRTPGSVDAADDGVVLTSYRRPEAVSQTRLDELPTARPLSSPAPTHSGEFRIQAGAFGDQDNARRAVARLSTEGAAVIEPIQKDGATYYRVFVPGAADEAKAHEIRERIAAAGFSDAKVVKPF